MIDTPPVLKSSEFKITPHSYCPNLKQGHWHKINKSMTGDAPKDFLGVYEYGAPGCKRANRKSWPRYIAKVGHKWYPNESITEHLITRIGQGLNLEVADSRLAHVRGQLRFMSRYFLHDTQNLVHGADIFASYLEDPNREFVQGIEDTNQSPEYFDYEFAAESVEAMFPTDSNSILRGFHRMLAFDALIGNNDRHFFNWGVVCDLMGRQPPRFSPIFDTARALFWNRPESGLSKILDGGKSSKDVIRKYCKGSCSKIGAAGQGKVNHFDLLRSVLKSNPEAFDDVDILARIDSEPVDLVENLLKGEFNRLISPLRQTWICRLIEYRTEQFRLVLKGEPTDA